MGEIKVEYVLTSWKPVEITVEMSVQLSREQNQLKTA